MKISLFRNVRSTEQEFVNVTKVLSHIQSGMWRTEIEKIRACSDKKKMAVLKLQLPVAIFSGTFDGARRDENLIEHSGFICLDFDDVDVDTRFVELSEDPYVYALFLSPSGRGLKALVQIPGTNHRGSFLSLQKRFPDVDSSGKDVSRCCFVSYDPNLYINRASHVFTGEELEKAFRVVDVDVEITDSRRIYDGLVKGMGRIGKDFTVGQRNDFTFKLLIDCCNFGIPQNEAELYVLADYISGTDIPESEFQATLKSAYRIGSFGCKKLGYRKSETQEFTLPRATPVVIDPNPVSKVKIIDVTSPIEKPDYCVTFVVDGVRYDTGFLGNMGVISGPPKSMKSTFLKGLGAGVLKNGDTILNWSTDFKQKTTLWFDTEQPEFRVLMGLKHMYRMAECRTDVNISRLIMHSLREIRDPHQRWKEIDRIIGETENLGLVVIDGIVDLCKNYNDQEESRGLVDWCLSITDSRKIVLINVIHIAKTTGQMRGHLGTELINKCDFAIEVTKDDGESKVTCKASRDKEFKDFNFRYGEDGLPHVHGQDIYSDFIRTVPPPVLRDITESGRQDKEDVLF